MAKQIHELIFFFGFRVKYISLSSHAIRPAVDAENWDNPIHAVQQHPKCIPFAFMSSLWGYTLHITPDFFLSFYISYYLLGIFLCVSRASQSHSCTSTCVESSSSVTSFLVRFHRHRRRCFFFFCPTASFSTKQIRVEVLIKNYYQLFCLGSSTAWVCMGVWCDEKNMSTSRHHNFALFMIFSFLFLHAGTFLSGTHCKPTDWSSSIWLALWHRPCRPSNPTTVRRSSAAAQCVCMRGVNSAGHDCAFAARNIFITHCQREYGCNMEHKRWTTITKFINQKSSITYINIAWGKNCIIIHIATYT